MMYRLSVLVVFLMLGNSATALAQEPNCVFTMDEQSNFFSVFCTNNNQPITWNTFTDGVTRGVIDVDMGEHDCLRMEVEVATRPARSLKS